MKQGIVSFSGREKREKATFTYLKAKEELGSRRTSVCSVMETKLVLLSRMQCPAVLAAAKRSKWKGCWI